MSKYHAKPVVVDNIRFHSTKEARRYQELRLLEKAGEVSNLKLQPRFSLCAGDGCYEIGIYVADFSYLDVKGRSVWEDVKGFDTPLSKWKRKHVKAQYGIEVLTT